MIFNSFLMFFFKNLQNDRAYSRDINQVHRPLTGKRPVQYVRFAGNSVGAEIRDIYASCRILAGCKPGLRTYHAGRPVRSLNPTARCHCGRLGHAMHSTDC